MEDVIFSLYMALHTLISTSVKRENVFSVTVFNVNQNHRHLSPDHFINYDMSLFSRIDIIISFQIQH